MSPVAYCFEFKAPKVAPTNGLPFLKKHNMAATLVQSCMIPTLLDDFCVKESDSDLILMIWYQDHPVLRTEVIFQRDR